MKKLFTICPGALLLFTKTVLAQPCGAHFGTFGCTDTIPAVANVISSSTEIGPVVNECYWICPGSELSIDDVLSGNLNIDMEAGSILNFNGNESTIWAKAGCVVNIGDCAPIIIIHIEPGVAVNYDTTTVCVIIDTCEEIIFDYSKAPAPGCFTAIQEQNQTESFSVFPNPAHGTVTIEFGTDDPGQIKIVVGSISGQQVFDETIYALSGERVVLSLPDITAGVYLVSVGELMHELLVVK